MKSLNGTDDTDSVYQSIRSCNVDSSMLLYMWSMIAPVLLPDRYVHGMLVSHLWPLTLAASELTRTGCVSLPNIPSHLYVRHWVIQVAPITMLVGGSISAICN